MSRGETCPRVVSPVARAWLPLKLDAPAGTDLDVTGWSMGAMMGPRATVRVQRLDGIPRRGSVVLLSAGENLVAHRVIALDRLAGHLTTKGDFCTFADAPVQMNDIAGVVIGVVRDGCCRTPFRMRRPWARFMAANSRCHAWLWARFPRAAPRLDVFGLLNRIIERLERWSA